MGVLPMKTVIYMRVSTSDQMVDSQRGELRRVAKLRGLEVVGEVEDVISGVKATRPGLERVMGMVRRGEVGCVLVYKMDRLGRSLSHLAQIIAELELNRVALVCVGQGIDTSLQNPAGRLQMHILMCVAEFERAMIRERTLAGLEAARLRGKFAGRPEVPKPEGWVEKVLALGTVRKVAAGLGVSKGTAGKWIKEAKGLGP